MPYRAENLEDLDWTFHKDGELRRETLVKRVLSTGAWPVIAYLYRNIDAGVPQDKVQICLIRYARKRSKYPHPDRPNDEPPKMWVPYHRLNLPTAALAWKVAARILEWMPPPDEDGGFPKDLVRFLDEAANAIEERASKEVGAKRAAAWKRKREAKAAAAAEAAVETAKETPECDSGTNKN